MLGRFELWLYNSRKYDTGSQISARNTYVESERWAQMSADMPWVHSPLPCLAYHWYLHLPEFKNKRWKFSGIWANFRVITIIGTGDQDEDESSLLFPWVSKVSHFHLALHSGYILFVLVILFSSTANIFQLHSQSFCSEPLKLLLPLPLQQPLVCSRSRIN